MSSNGKAQFLSTISKARGQIEKAYQLLTVGHGLDENRAKEFEIYTNGIDSALSCGYFMLQSCFDIDTHNLIELLNSSMSKNNTIQRYFSNRNGTYDPKEKQVLVAYLEEMRQYCLKIEEQLITDNGSIAGDVSNPYISPLTERELEFVELIARGSTRLDVSVQLGIQPATVTSYFTRVCDKLEEELSERSYAGLSKWYREINQTHSIILTKRNKSNQ